MNRTLTMAKEVRAGCVRINNHLIRIVGFPFGG